MGTAPEPEDATPAALHRRGVAALRAGDAAAAERWIGAALAAAPDWPVALASLGSARAAQGRHAEALVAFDRALSLAPDLPGAAYNRANALGALGRHAEAIAGYDHALACDPRDAEALCNRAAAAHALGDLDAAFAGYAQALALRPDLVAARENLGLARLAQGRFAVARQEFEAALALAPGRASLHAHLGLALLALDQPEAARAACARAVALRPDFAAGWNGLGEALLAMSRLEDAAASLDRAVALAPGDAQFRFNRALIRLTAGDYAAGWPDYEWRKRKARSPSGHRSFAQPLWLGTPALAGRTILLHGEQGQGDMIQFCRFARPVRDLGARVKLALPASLLRLAASLDPAIESVPLEGPPTDFDLHCPLHSLPLALGLTRLADIPAARGYLAPPPATRAAWAARLGPATRPRIGLAWSGNPAFPGDHQRSIAFARLRPLFGIDAAFHCLQTEIRARDAADVARTPHLVRHDGALADFAETAGLIAALDLVITSCTSVAHLAGAMGRPVWILLAANADWRWLRGRDDSPWYASARLFRQDRHGDWAAPVARLGAALAAWRAARPGT